MALDDHAQISLNLGLSSTSTATINYDHKPSKVTSRYLTEPSLTLTLTLSGGGTEPHAITTVIKAEDTSETDPMICTRPYNNNQITSSSTPYSSGISSVKRERDTGSAEEGEDRSFSTYRALTTGADDRSDEEEGDMTPPTNRESDSNCSRKVSSVRKKLRLSKDESDLLEQRFKQHSTLNPKQKQDLANQLNLRPRQVEVWFQNRRARTKLKQTETDYEFLKKYCETLTNENHRLHMELQTLRAATATTTTTPTPTFYKQAATTGTTLSLCPSCERVRHGVDGGSHASLRGGSKGTVVGFSTKSRFFGQFGTKTAATKPSAGTAC